MKLFFANDIQTYVGGAVPTGSTCILTLSQNAVTLVGNVLAQSRYSIPIVAGSLSQEIWFTDELNPSGLGYHIQIQVPNVGIVYDQQNVPITGVSFNLASFVPGSQATATGTVLPTFETNGTSNVVQTLLNLVAGTGITLSSDSNGGVTITGAAQGVTSVGLADSTGLFTITGSPITTTGTLTLSALASQTANHFLAAPNGSNGASSFRAIVAADIPTLNQNTTGTSGGLSGTPNISVGTITASGLITAQANIQIGVAGTTSGVITLEGSTSGAATITAPAVAGTTTNPIVFSNAIMTTETLMFNSAAGTAGQIVFVPSGSTYFDYLNTLSFRAISGGLATILNVGTTGVTVGGTLSAQAGITLGVANTTAGVITLEGSTSGAATITAPAVAGTAANPVAFSNGINIPSGTGFSINNDTFLYRSSANVWGVGNAVGSSNGTVWAAAFYGGIVTPPAGSATSPTIGFTTSPTTGFHLETSVGSPSSYGIGASVAGSGVLDIWNNGINLPAANTYMVNGLAVAAPVLISPGPSSITNTVLNSNVATYTCANNFVIGQLVSVTGCSAPYNVVLKPIVSASSTQFTVAITNANIGSAGASGLAYVPVEDTRGASTATAATPQFVISDAAANPLVYVTEPFSASPYGPTGATTLTIETYATGSASALNFITPAGGGVPVIQNNGVSYTAFGYGQGFSLLNAGGVSIYTSIAGQNSHNFFTGNNQPTIDMAQFTGSARSAPGSGFGRLEWLAGTVGGMKLVGFAGTSTVGSVIADNVGNGRNQTESCVAYVDATAQTATITTTTLYAVPAAGAGQYRLSWNAKVTTVATTSSTIGPLTVTYVDPDGVTQTITCGALSKSGAIETSDSGNLTSTVLLGLPVLINSASSQNITYAFTYASNTAAQMNYNLHIRLESL